MFRSIVAQSTPLARRAASTVTAHAPIASVPASVVHSYPVPPTRTILADIPARWTAMPADERDSVVDSLLAAQKGDWKTMSSDQKRALFFIAYGPHGPRERLPKGFQLRVFLATVGVCGISGALFYWIRLKGGQGVPTTTKEWQEAANEYARSQGANPYTGISADNYKGKGHVA